MISNFINCFSADKKSKIFFLKLKESCLGFSLGIMLHAGLLVNELHDIFVFCILSLFNQLPGSNEEDTR